MIKHGYGLTRRQIEVIKKRVLDAFSEAEREYNAAKTAKEEFGRLERTKKEVKGYRGKGVDRVEAQFYDSRANINNLVEFCRKNGLTHFTRKTKTHLWVKNLLIVLTSVFGVGTVAFMILWLTKGNNDIKPEVQSNVSATDTTPVTTESENNYVNVTEKKVENEEENIGINSLIQSALNKYSILNDLSDNKFREFIIYLNIDELGIYPGENEMKELEKSFYEVLEVISSHNMDPNKGLSDKINCSNFVINDYHKEVISQYETLRNNIIRTNGGVEQDMEAFISLNNYCIEQGSLNVQTREVIIDIIDQMIESLRNNGKEALVKKLEEAKQKLGATPSLSKYDSVFNRTEMLLRTRI